MSCNFPGDRDGGITSKSRLLTELVVYSGGRASLLFHEDANQMTYC
jgi:hypothetical protein